MSVPNLGLSEIITSFLSHFKTKKTEVSSFRADVFNHQKQKLNESKSLCDRLNTSWQDLAKKSKNFSLQLDSFTESQLKAIRTDADAWLATKEQFLQTVNDASKLYASDVLLKNKADYAEKEKQLLEYVQISGLYAELCTVVKDVNKRYAAEKRVFSAIEKLNTAWHDLKNRLPDVLKGFIPADTDGKLSEMMAQLAVLREFDAKIVAVGKSYERLPEVLRNKTFSFDFKDAIHTLVEAEEAANWLALLDGLVSFTEAQSDADREILIGSKIASKHNQSGEYGFYRSYSEYVRNLLSKVDEFEGKLNVLTQFDKRMLEVGKLYANLSRSVIGGDYAFAYANNAQIQTDMANAKRWYDKACELFSWVNSQSEDQKKIIIAPKNKSSLNAKNEYNSYLNVSKRVEGLLSEFVHYNKAAAVCGRIEGLSVNPGVSYAQVKAAADAVEALLPNEKKYVDERTHALLKSLLDSFAHLTDAEQLVKSLEEDYTKLAVNIKTGKVTYSYNAFPVLEKEMRPAMDWYLRTVDLDCLLKSLKGKLRLKDSTERKCTTILNNAKKIAAVINEFSSMQNAYAFEKGLNGEGLTYDSDEQKLQIYKNEYNKLSDQAKGYVSAKWRDLLTSYVTYKSDKKSLLQAVDSLLAEYTTFDRLLAKIEFAGWSLYANAEEKEKQLASTYHDVASRVKAFENNFQCKGMFPLDALLACYERGKANIAKLKEMKALLPLYRWTQENGTFYSVSSSDLREKLEQYQKNPSGYAKFDANQSLTEYFNRVQNELANRERIAAAEKRKREAKEKAAKLIGALSIVAVFAVVILCAVLFDSARSWIISIGGAIAYVVLFATVRIKAKSETAHWWNMALSIVLLIAGIALVCTEGTLPYAIGASLAVFAAALFFLIFVIQDNAFGTWGSTIHKYNFAEYTVAHLFLMFGGILLSVALGQLFEGTACAWAIAIGIFVTYTAAAVILTIGETFYFFDESLGVVLLVFDVVICVTALVFMWISVGFNIVAIGMIAAVLVESIIAWISLGCSDDGEYGFEKGGWPMILAIVLAAVWAISFFVVNNRAPACEHQYTSQVTNPTCTEQGYTTWSCPLCEHSYKDSFVDATGHTGEWSIDLSGNEYRYCDRCGEYETKGSASGDSSSGGSVSENPENHTTVDNGLEFEFNQRSGEYTLVGAVDSAVNYIMIQGELNGYPVTKIASNAFKNCKMLEEVVILDGIEKIGAGAFKNCENLRYLTVPNSIEKFGAGAFTGCVNLRFVSYMGTVEEWKEIKKGFNYFPLAADYRIECTDGDIECKENFWEM